MKRNVLLMIALWLGYQGAFGQVANFEDSNLPILKIYTQGETIVDEPKVSAQMKIVFNGVGIRNNVNGPFSHFNGNIGIEYRGSSSQSYEKKGYAIELYNYNGTADTTVSLLGMPKEADWGLIGPYNDKSLMRDALAYKFSS